MEDLWSDDIEDDTTFSDAASYGAYAHSSRPDNERARSSITKKTYPKKTIGHNKQLLLLTPLAVSSFLALSAKRTFPVGLPDSILKTLRLRQRSQTCFFPAFSRAQNSISAFHKVFS